MPLRVSPFKCFCSDLTTTTGTRTTAAAAAAAAAAATAMTTATTTTFAGASFAATATVTATTGKAAAAGGWVAGPQKDLHAKACMLVVRIPILPCGLTSSPSVSTGGLQFEEPVLHDLPGLAGHRAKRRHRPGALLPTCAPDGRCLHTSSLPLDILVPQTALNLNQP